MSEYKHVALAALMCGGLVGISAQAALLGSAAGFNPPSASDPNQFVFTTFGLAVENSLSSGNSQFSASSLVVNNGDNFTTPLSGTVTPFGGTFDLNATLAQDSQGWYVQSGTVSVYGNLLGNPTSDLLLTGSLLSGPANGREANALGAGGFGYDAHTFEFLFDVTGGEPGIVRDFYGLGAENSVLISVPAWMPGDAFDGVSSGLASPFESLGPTAFADTFSPEPSAYGLIASGVAAAALIMSRRRQEPVAKGLGHVL